MQAAFIAGDLFLWKLPSLSTRGQQLNWTDTALGLAVSVVVVLCHGEFTASLGTEKL